MELRQLAYFVGVADSGGFSEASRRLYVSQSAISQQIKLLEDELGSQLFVRHHNNVTLTESGRKLYPLARTVLEDVEECNSAMKELKNLLCGELNIGLTYSLEPFMRDAMLRFLRLYPGVRLNSHYKNLQELLRMLQDEEIDVMLSMMPASPHDFITSVALTEYRLAAVMNKSHVLARKKNITFRDLLPHKLILPEKGLRDRNAIESFVRKDTGNLHVQAVVNDVNALLNIIQVSNYVTILTETSIASRNYLCAVPIEELNEPIPIFAHFNNRLAQKNSATKFLEILRDTANMHQMI